jgi:hypothetical protein
MSQKITVNPFTGEVEMTPDPITSGTPVNAVAAHEDITFTGIPLAHVDNVNSSGEITVTGTPLEHVDHVHSEGEITVTGTPLEHVDHVHSEGEITVTGTPLAQVDNVQSTGTITVTGTPAVNEELVVGTQTFVFKAARSGAGEISIDEDNTDQAEFIAAAINDDVSAEATATSEDGIVTVTAVAAGTAGDLVLLTEAAAGIAVSGSGTLEGGVDEVPVETLTVGAQEFTFVALRAGAGEITIDADNTNQAVNIKTAINLDLATVTADNTLGVVTVTAVSEVAAEGDAIALEASATGIAVNGAGTLSGGVDEVPAETLTVGCHKYT